MLMFNIVSSFIFVVLMLSGMIFIIILAYFKHVRFLYFSIVRLLVLLSICSLYFWHWFSYFWFCLEWHSYFFFHRLSMLWVASNVVSLFYFCFLYVNVQYSFIIHVCRSHAIGYDIHHNLNIFQTCKFLILFHRSSFGSSIYMFFIEALLTFMFVFLPTTIRNVLLISFQWCNK